MPAISLPSVRCLSCESRLSAWDLAAFSLAILADCARFGIAASDVASGGCDWGWCPPCGVREFGL